MEAEDTNPIGIDLVSKDLKIKLLGLTGTYSFEDGLIKVPFISFGGRPVVFAGWHFRTYIPKYTDEILRQSWYQITELDPALNGDGLLCISTPLTQICQTSKKFGPIPPGPQQYKPPRELSELRDRVD